MKVLLVYPNLMLQTSLPNSLPILSACLKEAGHTVKLFETTYYKTEEVSTDERRVQRLQVKSFSYDDVGLQLKKEDVYKDFQMVLESYKPDLIGITLIDDTLDLAFKLLEYTGDIPVVAGGVSTILAPDCILSNPDVDYVCIGEGEKTIVDLCEYLEGKRFVDISHISNLGYKDKTTFIYNDREKPVDIDSLPFEDYSIFDEKRLYRPMRGKMVKSIPINLDRGCPYRCAFCCAPAIKKRIGSGYFRMKSISRIEEEIRHQMKMHPDVEFFYFNSESFLVRDIEFLKSFAEMYKKFGLRFWCQANIDTISDEKIRIVKEMGCLTMSVGLESGDEKFRRTFLHKNFSNEQVLKAFKIIKKYDIPTSVNNIIGYPEETRDQIFKTIDMNRRIFQIYPKASMSGFVFQPYRGTELYDFCLAKGYINKDNRTDTLIGNPTITNPYLSDEELKGLLRTFVMYIKFPKNYYHKIKKAEQDAAIFEKLSRRYWELYS